MSQPLTNPSDHPPDADPGIVAEQMRSATDSLRAQLSLVRNAVPAEGEERAGL